MFKVQGLRNIVLMLACCLSLSLSRYRSFRRLDCNSATSHTLSRISVVNSIMSVFLPVAFLQQAFDYLVQHPQQLLNDVGLT